MPHTPRIANIAVAGPLRKSFAYSLPPEMESLAPGQRVLVPFGRLLTVGYYIGETEVPDGIRLRNVRAIIDPLPLLPPDQVAMCLWMADYYFANPADCLAAALPPQLRTRRPMRLCWNTDSRELLPPSIGRLVRKGKPLSATALKRIREVGSSFLKKLMADGIVTEELAMAGTERKQRRKGYRITDPDSWNDIFARAKTIPEPFHGVRTAAEMREHGVSDHLRRRGVAAGVLAEVFEDVTTEIQEFITPRAGLESISLTPQQTSVVGKVTDALSSGFAGFLLHGITGSGKTLVYCHIAREVINTGRTVLIMTPEIALSSNTLAYFRGFFGNRVTVLHSAMNPQERLASWRGIRAGEYDIVIGPRSALFAPLDNLGLIVVDEEHDDSYKQDDPAPRFHGRDTAVMRARISDIPIVLGSASPSVESYHNATSGRYQLLELTERPGGATLPSVKLVDMRSNRLGGDLPFVSFSLKQDVEEALKQDRQVILFLNRRGYAPSLKCADCGHVPQCRDCQVRLTYHKTGNYLTCHYCGSVRREYDTCEKCGSRNLLFMGVGTQKVEESVIRLFPQARPVRLDSDTAGGRTASHTILSEFASHTYNLLLGTQMVTKGLDLPDVSLVGVLSADMGLDLPDFRASERTFARLLQVAGRSGRADQAGTVVIQTFYPDRDVIQDAAGQDYHMFYAREIQDRKESWYPPFSRLINVVLSAADDDVLAENALRFRDAMVVLTERNGLTAQVLGPAPCAFHRLQAKFRRHLFVKIDPRQITRLVRLLTAWEAEAANFGLPGTVRVTVDVDPIDML